MNTNEIADSRRAGESGFNRKGGTEKIIGFAFDVWRDTGLGLLEPIYGNTLTVLFRQAGVVFEFEFQKPKQEFERMVL